MAKKEAVVKISFRGEPYVKGQIPDWFREKATAFFEDLAKQVDVSKLPKRDETVFKGEMEPR